MPPVVGVGAARSRLHLASSPHTRKPVAPVAMARKKSGFAQLLSKGMSGPPAEARPKAPLKRGKLSPMRTVPPHIPRPPYADSGISPPFTMEPQVHGEEGQRRMREAGQLAARVRDHAGTLVKPGVTTDEIDRAVHEMIIEAGAYPSPLSMPTPCAALPPSSPLFPPSLQPGVTTDEIDCAPGVTSDEIDRAVHEMIIEAGAYPSPLSMPTPCAALPPSSPLFPPSLQPGVTTDEIDCAPGVTTDEIDRAVHEMIIEAGAYPSPLSMPTPCAALPPSSPLFPPSLQPGVTTDEIDCAPGVTTDEIDRAVHEMIIEAGAYPSPLNYAGFPKSVCTSVNECICHGIPDSRPLEDGDIINIDVTVYLNGYHGDTSKTFYCGNVSNAAKKLVEVTEEALNAAIAVCGPDAEFKKIGQAIHAMADKHSYGVVRKFIGHGVGSVFHAGPAVLHYRNNEPGRMQVGQTFTIEPMFTMGGVRDVMWDDGWTAVTADGTLTAQFEHTLLITETGVEVLTR
ncbi:unnamed protein product [Closterium sp. Naga37s-1]|nr:unnamed protein product [Closterium sp. Naga37s-1]